MTINIGFTPAEVVHLANDLRMDTRAKIGPRLSAAIKVVRASEDLLEIMRKEREATRD